jgi:hypothetical protein
MIVTFPGYRARAGDMREMARVADSVAAPDHRVLLYSFGEKRWDYRNQLIWYGHRLCRQLERLDDLSAALDEQSVAVIDRLAYAQLREKVVLRGESPNFVCVQGAGHSPARRLLPDSAVSVSSSQSALPARGSIPKDNAIARRPIPHHQLETILACVVMPL